MLLELNSLKKAINSLDNGIYVVLKKENNKEIERIEINLLMAGIIQNFEFTYELCWKFMKRWLESNISHETVDGITRKELFRIASENRLIDDVAKWFDFHKARNRTSHIYDEEIAEQVYEISKDFLPEAKLFLKRIEERND